VRNSAIADIPRDAFIGHQTWYHSICYVRLPINVL